MTSHPRGSDFHRLDAATRTRVDFAATVVSRAGSWCGLSLEEWDGAAEDLPESVLDENYLAIPLRGRVRSNVLWSDHGRVDAEFRAGMIGVFPAAVPYKTTVRGHWSGLIVQIQPRLLQSVCRQGSAARVRLRPGLGVDDPLLFQTALALRRDWHEGRPRGDLYGESLAVAAAAHLARHHALDDWREGTPLPDRADVREFILDQLGEPLSLSTMARYASMDLFSFSKWFKTTFGMPPYQFVLRSRIAWAAQLLADPEVSLTEIALTCGFSSQSHFTTTFRKQTGQSPGVYRRSRRLPPPE